MWWRGGERELGGRNRKGSSRGAAKMQAIALARKQLVLSSTLLLVNLLVVNTTRKN